MSLAPGPELPIVIGVASAPIPNIRSCALVIETDGPVAVGDCDRNAIDWHVAYVMKGMPFKKWVIGIASEVVLVSMRGRILNFVRQHCEVFSEALCSHTPERQCAHSVAPRLNAFGVARLIFKIGFLSVCAKIVV